MRLYNNLCNIFQKIVVKNYEYATQNRSGRLLSTLNSAFRPLETSRLPQQILSEIQVVLDFRHRFYNYF